MRNLGRAVIAIAVAIPLLSPMPANAAPSLLEVQAKVRDLQEQATAAAEGAQEAKVELAKLQKTCQPDKKSEHGDQQSSHRWIGATPAICQVICAISPIK